MHFQQIIQQNNENLASTKQCFTVGTNILLNQPPINQLINSGIISKPTANNVQLYPSDSGGYLYVIVTIPKIGVSTNVTYSFTTPSIFKKNFTTNEEIYFNFLDNSQVLATSYKPSDTSSNTTKLFFFQLSEI